MHYLQAVKGFIEKIKAWNRDDFGNIIHRKKRILARLGGIQKALESYPNSNLTQLELELKRDLERIMTQEEILWFQKSRRNGSCVGTGT